MDDSRVRATEAARSQQSAYRETLPTTGSDPGRVVIATREFTSVSSPLLGGANASAVQNAPGVRFQGIAESKQSDEIGMIKSWGGDRLPLVGPVVPSAKKRATRSLIV